MKTEKELEISYIANNAALCPFCESPHLSCGETDFCDTKVYRNVYCIACKKEWTEVFILSGVDFPFDYSG